MLKRAASLFAPAALPVQRGTAVATFGPFQLFQSVPDDGVIHVVINGPSKLNLLDNDFVDGLLATTSKLSEMEGAARVAVLYADEGKHFCAGLDLKKASTELFSDVSTLQKAKVATAAALGVRPSVTEHGQPAMRGQRLHRLIRRWQDGISSLARCRIPVIAAIHGHCIGGGLNLIAACDVRYCTETAVFSLREARVGITADIGALQRLPGIIGEGNTRELAFTARDFSGPEAEKLHLVNAALPNYDTLIRHSFNVAIQMAGNSPLAVQGCKEILNHQSERAVQDSLDYVRLWNSAFVKSEDLVEATMSFAQKREAQFTDYCVDSRSSIPAPRKSLGAETGDTPK